MKVAEGIREKRTQKGAVEVEGGEVQVQLTENKSSIEALIPKQVNKSSSEFLRDYSLGGGAELPKTLNSNISASGDSRDDSRMHDIC